MKRIRKLLFQRVVIVGLSILLQLALMVSMVQWLSEYRTWIRAFLTLLSVITVIYLMYDRTNASYKIAWIILILACPVAGISIYLAFGGRRLSRPVRKRMQQAQDMVRNNLWQEKLTEDACVERRGVPWQSKGRRL